MRSLASARFLLNWLQTRTAIAALIAVSLRIANLTSAQSDNPPLTIREMLDGEEFDLALDLVDMGVKVFPAFEQILSDPNAKSWEVSRIFLVVRQIPGNRRQFIEHAVKRLTDSDEVVRRTAVRLLGEIGSISETSPVVAALSDSKTPVVYFAAESLSAIGGPREVAAFDVWLNGNSHRDDGELRRHVKQMRDKLQQRLVDQAKKTKS